MISFASWIFSSLMCLELFCVFWNRLMLIKALDSSNNWVCFQLINLSSFNRLLNRKMISAAKAHKPEKIMNFSKIFENDLSASLFDIYRLRYRIYVWSQDIDVNHLNFRTSENANFPLHNVTYTIFSNCTVFGCPKKSRLYSVFFKNFIVI